MNRAGWKGLITRDPGTPWTIDEHLKMIFLQLNVNFNLKNNKIKTCLIMLILYKFTHH